MAAIGTAHKGKRSGKSAPRKFHVRSGDEVIVISGANKGKNGTIIKVMPDRERVLVDGEAAVHNTKHLRADPNNNVEGGRVQRLRPIHISNVALVDPSTGKACRIRRERVDGKPVRVSKASGHRFGSTES